MKKSVNWKVWIGILLSALFLYLSFRKVNFAEMLSAFAKANYWYVLPMLVVIALSHFLRSWRWQFLLQPIRFVRLPTLFSALLIGYTANSFLPAHLGELVRAYLVQRNAKMSGSAVFGTIVVERIIDVLTLLLLMALTLLVYPELPEVARQGGYFTIAGMVVIMLVLLVMKVHRAKSLHVLRSLTGFLAADRQKKITDLVSAFLEGVVPLKSASHYAIVVLLSLIIWACYGAVFQLGFYAFGFTETYSLPWMAALVLLVTTTIAVVVPSSPGYVGAYHYLCLMALLQFHVPESEALTFAFVVHGINFLPLIPVGLILISLEGLSLKQVQNRAAYDSEGTPQ